MRSLYPEFTVRFRYPVHFTERLFAPENPLLAAAAREEGGTGRLLFVLDAGVVRARPGLPAEIEAYCAAHGLSAPPPLVVPGGERVKNEPAWVLAVHRAIDAAGLCRHSAVAAVGGGAVLDMVGLAAATAHRGVRLLRVPTTVLAQNDSGVGVKNGINAFGKKNFLGTFAPPHAVLNDSAFLATLSDRDWRAGIAEAVKVALLKDAGFFAFLEAGIEALVARDMERMRRLIHRCAELHLEQIVAGGDPFERGSARPLDFGHWAAHRLERLTEHRLRHGEAVAIGMALDATYSRLTGALPEAEWRRILDLLRAAGFALYVPELRVDPAAPDAPNSLLRGLTEFHEHLGGRLSITLLAGIGRPFETDRMEPHRIAESVALLEAWNAGRRPEESEDPGAELPPAGLLPEHACRESTIPRNREGDPDGTPTRRLPAHPPAGA